jgi:hypothetical protein
MANLLCSSCAIARRDEESHSGHVGKLKMPLAVVNQRARGVARCGEIKVDAGAAGLRATVRRRLSTP